MFIKINWRRKLDQLAMTLLEIMIAMTIGVTMLGMAVASSVELYKNFAAATAYRNIHEDARKSLAFISRDIRSASNVSSFASSAITLQVINSTGAVDTIRYQLINSNLVRSVTTGTSTFTTNLLTDNVTYVNFERWTNPGAPASDNTDTYEIRASLTVTNSSSFRISSDLLQTRVLMRNKS